MEDRIWVCIEVDHNRVKDADKRNPLYWIGRPRCSRGRADGVGGSSLILLLSNALRWRTAEARENRIPVGPVQVVMRSDMIRHLGISTDNARINDRCSAIRGARFYLCIV